jgi:sec-independent protein translocase protein TatB
MLPGMGGFEAVVIALLALVIVGPKDLPVLMRKLARWVNKVRGMAAEFRMSFDELARQSELDELRREVEALRRGEPLAPVRDAIDPVARDINASFDEHDAAYRAAVAEANGEPAPAAEDPYTPAFEPAAPEAPEVPRVPEVHVTANEPTPVPAEPQSEAAPVAAAEPVPAPKRARRKSEPASVAGGKA